METCEAQKLEQWENTAMAAAVPVSERELGARYAKEIGAIAADAYERKLLRVFVDVLAWKLANIAYSNGPLATGDVLRRLGVWLCLVAEAAEAQREAEAERKQGRLPQ
jgi:hypothetical protein